MAAAAGPGGVKALPLAGRYGVVVALALLVLFGAARYDYFLGAFNVLSFLRYNSMFALVSLGVAFVIMSGGIDLSVGAVAALGSVASALASGLGWAPGLLAGLGAGLSAGLLNGALVGLAGTILAAQFGAGQPIEGVGWELFAIAAVVVGGTLLTGGEGSVGTTLAGALLLGLIFNILNFENGRGWISLSAYWQSVIRGVFLLVVVVMQAKLAGGPASRDAYCGKDWLYSKIGQYKTN